MEDNKCQNYQQSNVKDADTNGFPGLKTQNGVLNAVVPIGIETEKQKLSHRIACRKYYLKRIDKGLSGNHHLNTKCPICGNIKDNRAKLCSKCHCESGVIRRGTGKYLPIYSNGYKLLYSPNHLYANKAGYVPEHRLVIEKIIGRYLLRNEHVHHINQIRDDNRPTNLALTTNRLHNKIFHKGRFKNYTWEIINNKRVWICPH